MGSFVQSNVSICGILNFTERGKCRTLAVNPGFERGFNFLYQGVLRDWSSTIYCFLHMAELLLDVLESLLQ